MPKAVALGTVGRHTMIDLTPFLRRARASRARDGGRVVPPTFLVLVLLLMVMVILVTVVVLRTQRGWRSVGGFIVLHASGIGLRIA